MRLLKLFLQRPKLVQLALGNLKVAITQLQVKDLPRIRRDFEDIRQLQQDQGIEPLRERTEKIEASYIV